MPACVAPQGCRCMVGSRSGPHAAQPRSKCTVFCTACTTEAALWVRLEVGRGASGRGGERGACSRAPLVEGHSRGGSELQHRTVGNLACAPAQVIYTRIMLHTGSVPPHIDRRPAACRWQRPPSSSPPRAFARAPNPHPPLGRASAESGQGRSAPPPRDTRGTTPFVVFRLPPDRQVRARRPTPRNGVIHVTEGLPQRASDVGGRGAASLPGPRQP